MKQPEQIRTSKRNTNAENRRERTSDKKAATLDSKNMQWILQKKSKEKEKEKKKKKKRKKKENKKNETEILKQLKEQMGKN